MSEQTSLGPELDDFIRPMIGLAAWGVHQGYGSFLTFEFGQPRLIVEDSVTKLGRVAYAMGQWHLWTYCCHWRIFKGDEARAWSEDDRGAIDRACAYLNGQLLTGATIDRSRRTCRFDFDLGGSLHTWPYDQEPNEQWMIFTEAEVFTCWDDGRTELKSLGSNAAPHEFR